MNHDCALKRCAVMSQLRFIEDSRCRRGETTSVHFLRKDRVTSLSRITSLNQGTLNRGWGCNYKLTPYDLSYDFHKFEDIEHENDFYFDVLNMITSYIIQ